MRSGLFQTSHSIFGKGVTFSMLLFIIIIIIIIFSFFSLSVSLLCSGTLSRQARSAGYAQVASQVLWVSELWVLMHESPEKLNGIC